MTRKDDDHSAPDDAADRRTFLKGIAIGSAAAVTLAEGTALANDPPPAKAPPAGPGVREPRAGAPDDTAPLSIDYSYVKDPGSDFMVDVMRSLDVDYLLSNPARSFNGLHESLINYNGNKKPEWITCLHEEICVAMAHGYFKVAGKPLIALMHGTVGLQHATMAVYNAWCDRVPVIVLGGNDLDEAAPQRGREIISVHSAQDPNTIVRDYTKWDDTPVSLQAYANAMVRGYKIAMTPPYGPVMITVDASYQQEENVERARLAIPRYRPTAPPQGESGAVREAARLLVRAEAPVVVLDRAARSQEGVAMLVELCELLQAPAIDLRTRMSFPNTHYLCRLAEQAEALVSKADVILGLELANFWGTVNAFVDNHRNGEGEVKRVAKPGAKLISISSTNLALKANYQDQQRFQVIDLEMAADAQSTLPLLIQEVRSALSADRRRALAARGRALREQWVKLQADQLAEAKQGWDASPIATGRVTLELLDQIKGLDWALVGASRHMGKWPRRLWPFERHHQYLGLSGGVGLGYELPAAIGAALANRGTGRISVNLQSDGAMMYTPQAIWTAVHHKIPLLTVMMNNRAYQTETEHMLRISRWRKRKPNFGPDTGPIGTMIENPAIDYAKLAQSMGMWAIGPISRPAELGPALAKALKVVRAGQPALVDVITQPR
jgi:thiamine pyrophosphate-dependent acetolactate synthase large subunit-like protein